ncbi:Copper binding periplasmic protein CusF [anaerobic digester metagenome]
MNARIVSMISVISVAFAFALAGPVALAPPSAEASVVVAAAENGMAQGEVRRVDAGQGKITIRHGEIKNLQMPPMTMVFKVRDPAMLDAVKKGDRILFRAVQENGDLVITEIRPAP